MYKVIFEDKTIFEGGDFEDSKWNEIPDKPIKRLEYTLVRQTITFEGFESYNHLIERVKFVNKAGGKLTKIILMVLHKEKVTKITYDFNERKIYQKFCKLGEEYRGKGTTGWKKGIISTKKPQILVL